MLQNKVEAYGDGGYSINVVECRWKSIADRKNEPFVRW